LIIFLQFWKPKQIWRFNDEPAISANEVHHYKTSEILRALSPFIILTVMVLIWGVKPVKEYFNTWGQFNVVLSGFDGQILKGDTGEPIAQVFKLNYMSASGTAILFASLLSIVLLKVKAAMVAQIFLDTLKQLKFPIITIASILGFAYLVNNAGISLTMAEALSKTGWLFPFFAPVLGWLGVFITGSDTSSNALFSKLQYDTATSIGVDPVVTVGANISGGVVGKMISPQSIAVAAAAGNLVGKESELFRFTLKHSFILLILICLITLLQAYVFTWIIPGS
jgi:lactate permease